MKDSEGTVIKIGDTVAYARACNDEYGVSSSQPTVVRCKVTNIVDGKVWQSGAVEQTVVMGRFRTTSSEKLLIIN